MKNRLHPLFISFLASCYLLLASCTTTHSVAKCEDRFISIDSTYKDDSLMLTEIAPYKIKLDATMNEMLAISEQVLLKDQPEGLLGNFTADVVLSKAKEYCNDSCSVDLCVLNNGGLRNPLPKGNITRGNVFQLMPFENEMIFLTMNGGDVKDLFDFIANKGGMPVAGMTMKIKNNMADEVMIGGKPFDITKSYTVVTSDYLAGGGDNMTFFEKASRKIILGKKLRDAIIEYLQDENKKRNTIKVKKDGRIQFVQ
ncbi:MAG: 5'-nucleotidase C-terminal domain-containing protein [Bacteroidetes bacterium]|nr:5'-nucleotidase C-terminal domain-containing protein [Bacteroidota bacterium]